MGLPVEMELKVEPQPAGPPPPDRIDLAESLRVALHSRPSLAAGLEQLGVARADVEAARSAYGPTLSADGSLGQRDADLLPEDNEWSLGLTLSWPIFTGFARSHRLARTRAELSAEESTLRARTLQVQREVWSAYHALVETHESTEAARALASEAEESVRLSRERYEVGAGTINDLLDAQLALARAEVQLTASRWDCRQAHSTFRRTMGTLLSE
jgi:outer membrane protein TolC